MRFVNELVPLRLYSNKRKVYIPVNEKDKKHGAAIFLMGTTQEQNEKLLNAPFLYNPNNLFRAYYIDRNMMAYVNSDAINATEEEEFDEVQEAVLSEGMIHEKKVRFAFEGSSTIDERIANKIYNKDSIKYILLMTKTKECPLDKIYVHFYSTADALQKSCPFKQYSEKMYSYSYKDQIHVLSYTSYDERSMDGPYDLYLKAELINCIIQAEYPELSKKIAICTAMALSGQVEWLRKKKGKEIFKYHDSEDEGISGLYMADLILQLYQTKGPYGIRRLLSGDAGALANIAGNRIIAATRDLINSAINEANLSSSERNSLKDSDFGIPSKRKYPMPDAAHVKAAIRMFNHCDSEDEAELARRIKAKMKKFGVTAVEIGEKNRLSKYIHTSKANESVLISGQDTEVNLDKWSREKGKNILFVIGLSGSGKSTLAEKYEREKPNCTMFELDGIEYNYDSSNANILAKLRKEYPEYADAIDTKFDGIDHDKRISILKTACKKAIDIMYNISNKFFVVEGVQLYDFFTPEFVANKPLVIKNTSMLQSILRRFKRNGNGKIDWGKELKNEFIGLLGYYWDEHKKFTKFKKNIKESAPVEPYKSDVPGVEYADNGDLFAGEHSEDYYDVLTIVKDFSKAEFDRISFNSTYKDSPWIKKRIVLRDQNNYPMSFMDVYHFPSDPERAQITTAVAKPYRGNHLCSIMFKMLINSGFAEENGIKKYIWHVHPDNEASEKIAIRAGFKKSSDDLDKYGRYTYVYYVEPESLDANSINLPAISIESKIQISESAAFIINEADAKNDLKFKRYLYNERLKNARAVMGIYDQVKQRNPNIDRTFRELKLYRGLNVYVDTSYYHGLYLKNAFKGNKRAFYMYFDFVSRLMDNEDILKDYKKVTYFFPVQFTRDDQSVDDLFDFNNNLSPISLIAYFIRRDPDILKRWANKDILFIGDGGYFRVSFKNFVLKDFNRFKKNIEKLLTTREIVDNNDDGDAIEPASTSTAITAKVIDKIEADSKIPINNIAPASSIKIHHLSYEEDLPQIVDKKGNNAIMVLAKDSSSVIATISSKGIASKDIKSYYKPKV